MALKTVMLQQNNHQTFSTQDQDTCVHSDGGYNVLLFQHNKYLYINSIILICIIH